LERVALREPAVCGANFITIVQLVNPATAVPQLLVAKTKPRG
jgi:hypothetical protein